MKQGGVGAIVVGADRVAANGDTANKIGTYQIAVLAREHNIPFYVAAPISTFDLSIASGEQIPIEERSSEEVTHIGGVRIAPPVHAAHPAFRRNSRAFHRRDHHGARSGPRPVQRIPEASGRKNFRRGEKQTFQLRLLLVRRRPSPSHRNTCNSHISRSSRCAGLCAGIALPGGEMQSVISVRVCRKPQICRYIFAIGIEYRRHVVFLLWHRLAVALHNLQILVFHPDAPLKIPLPVLHFLWRNIENIRRQLIQRLVRHISDFVVRQFLRGQNKRLNIFASLLRLPV